jgi:enolase
MVKKYKIKKIKAREIFNSKNNPTVEVEMETDFGSFLASVPSGTSKGKYEALELRDKNGGVKKAIENIEKIIFPAIKEENLRDQMKIDGILNQLDGTENKSNLGVNAILPVSLAVCRAGAVLDGLPLYKYIRKLWEENFLKQKGGRFYLPAPSFNILNGGLHSANDLDFQEFMVVPFIKESKKKEKYFFEKSLKAGKEIYEKLKIIAKEKYGEFETGAEGGVAPKLKTPEEALNLVLDALKQSGYEKDSAIFLDVAASNLYKNGVYETAFGKFNSRDLIEYYSSLTKKYPIFSIEDPFFEDDWVGFAKITKEFCKSGKNFMIVGDDLLATNPKRIKEAKKKKACNALLLKLNQIGTVSEGMQAALIARKGSNPWKIMVSHRSGETQDDFIADFALGIGAEFIKSGAPNPKERMVKYDRLVKIEKETEDDGE